MTEGQPLDPETLDPETRRSMGIEVDDKKTTPEIQEKQIEESRAVILSQISKSGIASESDILRVEELRKKWQLDLTNEEYAEAYGQQELEATQERTKGAQQDADSSEGKAYSQDYDEFYVTETTHVGGELKKERMGLKSKIETGLVELENKLGLSIEKAEAGSHLMTEKNRPKREAIFQSLPEETKMALRHAADLALGSSLENLARSRENQAIGSARGGESGLSPQINRQKQEDESALKAARKDIGKL